ncbi:hypothetical protein HanXRQr2_Chr06g0255071 [Helianthus annuus]|uniref:Uncharacterized protein n=1 Tax=Helianthus annuus TaxID=4232 RepID=A0A9K3IU21_HELAN|nr:hypothetical protein HanXRQr2_Chr06g0255071 [Helianthus annuus]KAJ0915108.1 hypothetical protein HanPSC8_Chr06g0246161 [Helianthus annuus]
MAARFLARFRSISGESFSPCMFRSETSEHLDDILEARRNYNLMSAA